MKIWTPVPAIMNQAQAKRATNDLVRDVLFLSSCRLQQDATFQAIPDKTYVEDCRFPALGSPETQPLLGTPLYM